MPAPAVDAHAARGAWVVPVDALVVAVVLRVVVVTPVDGTEAVTSGDDVSVESSVVVVVAEPADFESFELSSAAPAASPATPISASTTAITSRPMAGFVEAAGPVCIR